MPTFESEFKEDELYRKGKDKEGKDIQNIKFKDYEYSTEDPVEIQLLLDAGYDQKPLTTEEEQRIAEEHDVEEGKLKASVRVLKDLPKDALKSLYHKFVPEDKEEEPVPPEEEVKKKKDTSVAGVPETIPP